MGSNLFCGDSGQQCGDLARWLDDKAEALSQWNPADGRWMQTRAECDGFLPQAAKKAVPGYPASPECVASSPRFEIRNRAK